MAKDLQSIFDAITPDNIKDVPVIKDAMEMFIELLEEQSEVSIDMKNAFSNTAIREELIKIYLDDLYTVFQKVKFNKKVIDKIESTNKSLGTEYYKSDAITNLVEHINDEHFLTMRAFKEKKGTVAGIKYMYDLISIFMMSNVAYDFEIVEGDEFEFEVNGSLPSEFYEYIVRPLAHPLGFSYAYSQLLNLALTDYFPEEQFNYTINQLEVRCLLTDGSTVVTDFQYDDEVERVVVDVSTVISDSTRTKTITFEDGTYLKQITDSSAQTYVYYMSAEDEVITTFSGQCSIYFDYDTEFVTGVTEDFDAYTNSLFDEEYGEDDDLGETTLEDNMSYTMSDDQDDDYHAYVLYEPIYKETDHFIDYNGVDRGTVPNNMVIGGSRSYDPDELPWRVGDYCWIIGQEYIHADSYVITVGGYRTIDGVNYDWYVGEDDFIVGGSYEFTMLKKDNAIDENPNLTGQHICTRVFGEPVQFQYNTYDYFDCGVYRDDVLVEDNNYSAYTG